MKPVLAALLFAAGLMAACSTPTGTVTPVDDSAQAAGRAVAVLRCSRCHALDEISQSPLPAAPPMADMLKRYDPEMLANDLIDGIRVGHDEMPEFNLLVAEADALVAYLKSLR